MPKKQKVLDGNIAIKKALFPPIYNIETILETPRKYVDCISLIQSRFANYCTSHIQTHPSIFPVTFVIIAVNRYRHPYPRCIISYIFT